MSEKGNVLLGQSIHRFLDAVHDLRTVPASIIPMRNDSTHQLPDNLCRLWRGVREHCPQHAPALLAAAEQCHFSVLPWGMGEAPDLVPWLLAHGISPDQTPSPWFQHLNRPAVAQAIRATCWKPAPHSAAHNAALLALLRAGANLVWPTTTVWHLAALDDGRVAHLDTALRATSRHEDTPSFDSLVEGWSPLAYAVLKKNLHNVRTLLAWGADATLRVNDQPLTVLAGKDTELDRELRRTLESTLLRHTLPRQGSSPPGPRI